MVFTSRKQVQIVYIFISQCQDKFLCEFNLNYDGSIHSIPVVSLPVLCAFSFLKVLNCYINPDNPSFMGFKEKSRKSVVRRMDSYAAISRVYAAKKLIV